MEKNKNKPAKKGSRYKLMFFNERKEEVVFSFRMSTWVAALLFVLVLALTAILVVIIMTQTPLRSYLPGYLDVEKRAAVVETGLRLDSLERESDLRTAYLQNLTDILSDRVKVDSIIPYDSAVVVRFNDSLIRSSAREDSFVMQFEEREKYSLNAITQSETLPAALFLAPVKGIVELPEDETEVGSLPGVRLRLLRETPVLAPLDGTVVALDFTIDEGYKMTLQHANDFVTVLSNLSLPLTNVGHVVKAGHVVAQAGKGEAISRWVGLQIWHKGKAIDPQSVISF